MVKYTHMHDRMHMHMHLGFCAHAHTHTHRAKVGGERKKSVANYNYFQTFTTDDNQQLNNYLTELGRVGGAEQKHSL